VILSPYIHFKTDRLRDEWISGPFQPMLYVVVNTAAWWHYTEFGIAAVITSLYRPDGIHKTYRAADLRTTHISEFAHKWEFWLNSIFPYKGKAGCNTALVHEVKKCQKCGKHFQVELVTCPDCGGKGKRLGSHLHLQIGPLEPWPDEIKPAA